MLKTLLQETSKALNKAAHPTALQVAQLLQSVDVRAHEPTKTFDKPAAFAAMDEALYDKNQHALTGHLKNLVHHFEWTSARLSHDQPDSFVGDYCFCRIVGEGGLIFDDRFRFGVYLQMPNTFYPSHKHAAEEIYFPVAGTAHWQKDAGEFAPGEVGTLIHHASYQPHATQTFAAPMLALWAWVGDLSTNTYSFVTD